MLYDQTAKKRPTNLSVNEDLLKRAAALELNLSRVLEEALIAHLLESGREKWISDSVEAIESFNQRVDEQGSFGDRARRF